MRPNISGSLRRIALGVFLPAVLTSTGCYHSMMTPGYGYGAPMYGNQYPNYGGYQGIQTLTPGTYYAPGTSAPTYNSNGLSPTPDPNSGGASGGAGGSGQGIGGGGGGNAPPYSPPVDGNPSRPVPMYDGTGSDSSAPADEAPVQQNDSGAGAPTTMKPAPNADWSGSGVEPASANETQEAASEPLRSTEPVPELETIDRTEEAEEAGEEPPLLAPIAPEPGESKP